MRLRPGQGLLEGVWVQGSYRACRVKEVRKCSEVPGLGILLVRGFVDFLSGMAGSLRGFAVVCWRRYWVFAERTLYQLSPQLRDIPQI